MQTKTPIYDFVSEYIQNDMSRLHMPGHKGKNVLGCEERDITEIDGADYLLKSEGIIKESETIASSLFDTACTIYSTEGSTLALKTMLRLAMQYSDSSHFRILAARNVHTGFVHACALLDIDVDWLINEELDSLTSCMIIPERLAAVLKQMEEKPDAVYITSPDYVGKMADIRGLAEVCHAHNILLLVDNAHGAYLHFLETSLHPIDLGTDLCCDSAHKTLPVLTGGAYLHVSKRMAQTYCDLYENAKKAMSLFASTSPSYLILQSLDLCNAYLSSGFPEQLKNTCIDLTSLKNRLEQLHIRSYLYEPLKLTIDCTSFGMSGTETAAYLRQKHLECEYADNYDLVLMMTPKNDIRDFIRFENAFSALTKKTAFQRDFPVMPKPIKACSIREALLANSITITTEEAEGCICACPSVSCPPAIPIAVSGEILTKEILQIMKSYHIQTIDVVRK